MVHIAHLSHLGLHITKWRFFQSIFISFLFVATTYYLDKSIFINMDLHYVLKLPFKFNLLSQMFLEEFSFIKIYKNGFLYCGPTFPHGL
jgi:hypothetical protein